MVQINKQSPLFRWHILSQRNSRTIYISGCLSVSTPHLFDRIGWLSKLPKWAIPFSTFLCSVCIHLPCCLITRVVYKSLIVESFSCAVRQQGTLLLSLVQHTNVQNILLLWFFSISVLHKTWHNIYNYHDFCVNNWSVYLHQGTSKYAITKIWDVFWTQNWIKTCQTGHNRKGRQTMVSCCLIGSISTDKTISLPQARENKTA